MNITKSLLYLLLLYAVLDGGKRLSLTTGLTIAFVIMLLNCYIGNNLGCNNGRSGWNNGNNNCCCNNSFWGLNGI